MAHITSPRLRIDPSDPDAGAAKPSSRTPMPTRQPERVVRTLKMPLLRPDVDDGKQNSAEVVQDKAVYQVNKTTTVPRKSRKQQAKQRTRPATVVEQLKHCLDQYELLQKQLLCAELTGTSVADHQKFEQAAAKLIRRITGFRQQLAEKAESVHRTGSQMPVTPEASVAMNAATVISPPKVKVASASQPKRMVKLSVSHQTAMVLKAFADAGKRPSALVERALWADGDVQDAALLLNLSSPTK